MRRSFTDASIGGSPAKFNPACRGCRREPLPNMNSNHASPQTLDDDLASLREELAALVRLSMSELGAITDIEVGIQIVSEMLSKCGAPRREESGLSCARS
jgi:hypothetical protein